MRKLVFILLLFAAPCFGDEPPAQYVRLFNMHNAYRKAAKVPALEWDDRLAEAAESQAKWMASTGRRTHLRGRAPRNGTELDRSNHHPLHRMYQAGYLPRRVFAEPNVSQWGGENIYIFYPPYRLTEADLIKGWKRSPGHNKTMLDNYQEIGIFVQQGKHRGTYVVVVFGKIP